LPEWKIELSDTGNYYIKFGSGNLSHNSDGLGEGLISLFFMIDSLYDSQQGDIIVIDEPELSLHPSLQKRLIKLFAEYAKDRQIVISTHSPYFIDWSSIKNGAKIARVIKEDNIAKIYQLSGEISEKIKNMGNDLNNPHVFGLDANEVFFLEDNIILVEGQEDVIFYNKIMNELGIEIKGDFYGWGVGGSSKMNIIASILRELGFKRVVGILDQNKELEKDELIKGFPEYNFFCIPADDVRTKEARKAKEQVTGLVDEKGKIRTQYEGEIKALFSQINSKLSTS
jgi:predicted ATP-dependent endonuclease of OLD family